MSPGAEQDKITRYWHLHARDYDAHELSRLHMGAAKETWAAVWRGALPDPPADVLDVATGTGQVSLLLAELGHRVVGIDLAEGMLAVAREKSVGMANPPTLQRGDAIAPAFAPASFDAVVCRYLLWTLREPDRALAAWRRLLRPGGVVVAVDGPWLAGGADAVEQDFRDEDELSTFRRFYDAEVLSSLPLAEATSARPILAAFAAAGFEDVRAASLPQIQRLELAGVRDTAPIRLQFMIRGRTR